MKRPVALLAACLALSDARGDVLPLQARIDAAPPDATIEVEAATYPGPICINKPLKLIGLGRPEIRGNGEGSVVLITAPDVTVRGFRITGSGRNLLKDDAGIHITGDRATIEDNQIEECLHGIYLKKVADCRLLRNRIRGRADLPDTAAPIGSDIGQSAENCDADLAAAVRRGNGIHQWNSTGTLIDSNEVSDMRDGIYFSFTSGCRVESNTIHGVRYGLHYMYSNDNVFENNSFSENAAGAAVMFSQGLVVRHNRFVSNRGLRAYGLILQSTDHSSLEGNEIEQNAVGLSFNQCNGNRVIGNRLRRNYIGLRFGSNSEGNQFSENLFERNLHAVEIGGGTGDNRWAIGGVGNYWSDAGAFDLDGDGINDLPHRELDLFGILRCDFPAIGLLSDSPAVNMLRFAHEKAALPGAASIDDPAPLTRRYWKIRAQRAAQLARDTISASP